MNKIGFGGRCHWCTEAIFQSLKGVSEVGQGWIASEGTAAAYSEAVIVEFDPQIISLETLIAVHLHSHSCTSIHQMRSKYRSAVYTFDKEQQEAAQIILHRLQKEFNQPVITQVIPFSKFKLNSDQYLNYYYSDPQKPFCQNIVAPKLKLLMDKFGKHINAEKLMMND
jgi:peptide-methionine (S)-S-oxide reductase